MNAWQQSGLPPRDGEAGIIRTPNEQVVVETRLSEVFLSFRAMFRRGWKLFAIVTLAVLALAIAGILMMTPKFDATTQLRIDPSRNPLASVQPEAQGTLSSEAIETEVSVLSSPELAREVVRRFQLVDDPEFNQNIVDNPALSPAQKLNSVAANVARNLTVSREKLTYILSVTFRSGDSIKAAKLANGFAAAYMETRVGSRVGSAERQDVFFKQQLADLNAAAQQADARLAQYRADHGLVTDSSNGTIIDQQIAPLSTQLATAESDAAEARSNLNAAKQQVARGGIDAVSAVRTSPVVGELRRQRADIVRQMTETEARYGPKHPEMMKVRDQLSQIDAQINAEARRAVGSLEAEAQAADARAGSLRSAIASLHGRQITNSRASVEAESLMRDAQNKREAYEKVAAMSLQSAQAVRNNIAPAEIVTVATPPRKPTSPRRMMLGSLGLVVALSLGFAAVVIREMAAGGLRNANDIRTILGLQMLGAIPDTRRGPRSGRIDNPPLSLVTNPTTIYAESVRNARTSIGHHCAKRQSKSIAITSSLPNEGKSTFALSLARMMAANGSRVILVDCDIRKGSLAKLAGFKPGVDIVDVMTHTGRLADAIVADHIDKLHLILSREGQFGVEDPFGGETMTRMLAELYSRYDVVILDLPPMIGIADARIVAARADTTVLVARWGSTSPNAARHAIEQLHNDGATIAGAVLTFVPPGEEAVGGLYYSRQYQNYFRAA